MQETQNLKQPKIRNFELNIDEVIKNRKSQMIVIPAPYQVRGKLQPGDRREAEWAKRASTSSLLMNLQKHWTPVFTGETIFYETVKIEILNIWILGYLEFIV